MLEEIIKIFDAHILDVLGEKRIRQVCKNIYKCLKNKKIKSNFMSDAVEFCRGCEYLMCNTCKHCLVSYDFYQIAVECPHYRIKGER